MSILSKLANTILCINSQLEGVSTETKSRLEDYNILNINLDLNGFICSLRIIKSK